MIVCIVRLFQALFFIDNFTAVDIAVSELPGLFQDRKLDTVYLYWYANRISKRPCSAFLFKRETQYVILQKDRNPFQP